MNIYNKMAFVLISTGIIFLVYSQIFYSTDAFNNYLKPVGQLINEKRYINASFWVSIITIITGAVMLLFPQNNHSLLKVKYYYK